MNISARRNDAKSILDAAPLKSKDGKTTLGCNLMCLLHKLSESQIVLGRDEKEEEKMSDVS